MTPEQLDEINQRFGCFSHEVGQCDAWDDDGEQCTNQVRFRNEDPFIAMVLCGQHGGPTAGPLMPADPHDPDSEVMEMYAEDVHDDLDETI